MLEDGTTYRVFINLPKLEYFVPSEHYTFVKILSLTEVQEYCHQLFFDWHLTAIDHLQRQPLFTQHLLDIKNKTECGINIRHGKSGTKFDLWGIEKRNQRFSNKREENKRKKA